MNHRNLIEHFKNAEEIVREAVNIGDVSTPEGKRRAVTFIVKAEKLYSENNYSIPMTLPNGLEGKFTSHFSKDVMDVIRHAVEEFKKACNPPTDKDYYFVDGKLKPGLDSYDNLIGNLLVDDVVYVLHYGGHIAKTLLGGEMNPAYVTDYVTMEEVVEMEDSCKRMLSEEKDAPSL